MSITSTSTAAVASGAKAAPLTLAVVGLDLIQTDWIAAVQTLAKEGAITPVSAGHARASAAKDVADIFGVPAFDDLRQMMVETQPKVILLDRPENASLEWLLSCVEQNIALFSLGPVVGNLSEARALAGQLDQVTPYLYTWPRLMSSAAYAHTAQADEYVKPVRFATADFHAYNHALAKVTGLTQNTVRSLASVAWDAFSTLIDLLGMPENIYAVLRGNAGVPGNFLDISGHAAITLRFAEETPVSLVLSDTIGAMHRSLTLAGQQGHLHFSDLDYRFTDPAGKLIDEGTLPAVPSIRQATEELRAFLQQVQAPPSPHRGKSHLLEPTAATLEAMLVSHRTGSAESPGRLLALRR